MQGARHVVMVDDEELAVGTTDHRNHVFAQTVVRPPQPSHASAAFYRDLAIADGDLRRPEIDNGRRRRNGPRWRIYVSLGPAFAVDPFSVVFPSKCSSVAYRLGPGGAHHAIPVLGGP